ncbi:unnamed protein product, partial [Mesorhabditis belari]|uniref:Eukaryotic translation initiation factor 3 subunit G n=1 Tax=Mesorhabditis belari TaxID=2138241 RepID=A0AAF3F086_9BILA
MATADLLSSAPEAIESWAEAVEQETRSESIKDGVKTVTDMVEEDGKVYKVVTQFKIVTKKVPRSVAERRGPQVSTTYVAEEVEMQFVRNRAGEQILDVQEEKQQAKTTSREHCRHCKANDHWSTNCPYKEMYQVEEEVDLNAAPEKPAGPGAPGRYMAPGMRGGERPDQRRSDENTCRVTNLPQEVDEQELRELFTRMGRVQRVFIARDKQTNLPKGFAYITYDLRLDAEKAIEKLNGYKYEHMVMHVELAK